ncbi:MAG TPA: hypothetical protein VGK01_13770, partial [Candidatus Angelobacter sp.]
AKIRFTLIDTVRFVRREVVMPDQCGNFSGWQECSRMAVKIRSVSTAESYRIIRLHADEEVGTSGIVAVSVA